MSCWDRLAFLTRSVSGEGTRRNLSVLNMATFLKTTSVCMIIAIAFPLSAAAGDRFLDTKMVGKLTMVAILSVTALVVRMLIERDRNETAKLHQKLGAPDRSIEFQEGFCHWRVEWHGNSVYIFRDGSLYEQHPAQ